MLSLSEIVFLLTTRVGTCLRGLNSSRKFDLYIFIFSSLWSMSNYNEAILHFLPKGEVGPLYKIMSSLII